jgi:hypothetical protein
MEPMRNKHPGAPCMNAMSVQPQCAGGDHTQYYRTIADRGYPHMLKVLIVAAHLCIVVLELQAWQRQTRPEREECTIRGSIACQLSSRVLEK